MFKVFPASQGGYLIADSQRPNAAGSQIAWYFAGPNALADASRACDLKNDTGNRLAQLEQKIDVLTKGVSTMSAALDNLTNVVRSAEAIMDKVAAALPALQSSQDPAMQSLAAELVPHIQALSDALGASTPPPA